MPELPEVEIVRRGLESAMLGKGRAVSRLTLNRAGLRYPFTPGMENAVAGRAFEAFERRGKYIISHFAGGGALVWHLGMSGSIRIFRPGEPYTPALHDHAVFMLRGAGEGAGDGRGERAGGAAGERAGANGEPDGGTIVFNDPRRFGFLLYHADGRWREAEPFASMGPEPLGNDFHAPALAARLAGRKSPVKTALLDQKVVAGLGNIYVCEALWQARISPSRAAGALSEGETESLARAIRDVLTRAIAAGGSSLRDYRHTDGGLGCFQHRFSVYDREGESCPACAGGCRVSRIVQAGRSTFYCPKVQL